MSLNTFLIIIYILINKSSKWHESGGQTSKAMKCRGVVLMIHLEKHKERRRTFLRFSAWLGFTMWSGCHLESM